MRARVFFGRHIFGLVVLLLWKSDPGEEPRVIVLSGHLDNMLPGYLKREREGGRERGRESYHTQFQSIVHS